MSDDAMPQRSAHLRRTGRVQENISCVGSQMRIMRRLFHNLGTWFAGMIGALSCASPALSQAVSVRTVLPAVACPSCALTLDSAGAVGGDTLLQLARYPVPSLYVMRDSSVLVWPAWPLAAAARFNLRGVLRDTLRGHAATLIGSPQARVFFAEHSSGALTLLQFTHRHVFDASLSRV